MEFLIMFMMFLSALVDGFLLVFLYMNSAQIKEAVLIHMLVYLFMKVLAKKYLTKYEGVPFFLALFLPCLGWLLVSCLYFSLYYFLRDSMVLDDYERYVIYDHPFDIYGRIDLATELRTLSFLDQMNLLDAQSKKNVIMDLGINHSDQKIRLLQRGLQDEDVEVKHYSAVTINMIENELSQLITELREEYNKSKDSTVLQELAKVYKNYIESSLISGMVFRIFNSEYLEILHKLRECKKGNVQVLEEIIKTYIRLGNLKMAQKYNTILIESYPHRIEGFLNQLQCAFESRDLAILKNIISDYLENNAEIDPKLQDVLSFWKGNEENL